MIGGSSRVTYITGAAPVDTYGQACPYGCGSTQRHEWEDSGHRWTHCVGCGEEISHFTIPLPPAPPASTPEPSAQPPAELTTAEDGAARVEGGASAQPLPPAPEGEGQ